ncbi:hypothetical protein PsAD46_03343 [Pseudovibrio sp. Ad46]|uniref:DUF6362 family protein n=1 Tax=Pseudovibrio sp. Ad46 TaxID=989432 RepID=UPI0007AEB8B6|nr:DUF6362 family protein [Pseudovibrio sp. Ad46]KZK85752.1 hypothetical protein PsAD46_03343 [Pseudovibrio sp. Ad46]
MSDIQALYAVILDRLIEAQVVMRLMKVRGVRPGQPQSFWPDFNPSDDDQWEAALNAVAKKLTEVEKRARNMAGPDAAAIARMEETWDWMHYIKRNEERKALSLLVFCYAYKIQPKKVLDQMGLAKQTAHDRFNRALHEIAVSLCNKTDLPAFACQDLSVQFRPKSGIYSDKMRTLAA